MLRVLLVQLPIPQMNFGMRTANVPMAAACLKLSLAPDFPALVEILPESLVSYVCDKALISQINEFRPDVVGFSVFNWNLGRSLHVARKLKEQARAAIIFGGPEITPDNPALSAACVDYLVYGEGEPVFQQVLENISEAQKEGSFGSLPPRGVYKAPLSQGPAPHAGFSRQASPYAAGFLEPSVDGLMYLESQRGCAYRCGFCYYNKARKKIALADFQNIVDAVTFAKTENIPEICLIDPSVDTRPDLPTLLQAVSRINADKTLAFTGEIRAESITPELADGFAAAGFTGFEIGLQTINSYALAVMNRKTDLDRFLTGTCLLKERGIVPRIDLIVGLPGDDPEGFQKSLRFVRDNDLARDVQIFPLSVLPGTDFREKSGELGLLYDAFPPYLVRQTSGFSQEDMAAAFDHAENLLDISLFPEPYLDVAFRQKGASVGPNPDVLVRMGNRDYIKTLVLNARRPLAEITAVAGRLASPYQIHIGRTIDDTAYICQVIEILTSENPHTPFEMIFWGQDRPPEPGRFLRAVRLFRPGYPDAFNTFKYPREGCRSVLFTWVTRRRDVRFEGEMQRVVFWWEKQVLPEVSDLEALGEFDGIVIDAPVSEGQILDWQNRMAGRADDLIFVSFSDIDLQRRWLGLTAGDVFSQIFLNHRGHGDHREKS